MGMFNFGSKESSSSSSSTTNNTTTNNQDKRLVTDGSSIGLSSENSTTNIIQSFVDGGAFSFASEALNTVSDSVSNALATSGIVSVNALNVAGDTASRSLLGMYQTSSNALAANGIVTTEALYANTNAAQMAMDAAHAATAAMADVSSNALASNGIVSVTALNGAFEQATTLATQAQNNNNAMMAHAADIVSNQSALASKDYGSLLGATLQLSRQAYDAMDSNLLLAKDLNSASQSAYSGASEQAAGNKNIVLAGLAVVALAAVMAFGKH